MRVILILTICHLIAAVISPAIWHGVFAGYPGDSFWTLSEVGRIGVIVISISGMVMIACLNAFKTRTILRRSQHRQRILVWLLDSGLGICVFGLFYVLSPQVFYALYQQLIPGLPDQLVIDSAANWKKFADIIIPRMNAPMSDHLAGVAIGGIVLFTAYLHRR